MDASGLLQSLKKNPVALTISVALHMLLFVMLAISLSNSEVPRQNTSERETVKAFVVDADAVDEEIKKLKQSEVNKKQKIKNETDRLKQQLEKEKNRLAKIKQEKRELERKSIEKKKLDKKREISRQKAEADKKKEVVKRELEAKKKAEDERLAAIKKQQDEIAAQKQREIEEIAAQKQREIEEKELQRKMEEEERRLAKHNDMLKSLRSQYVRLIEQKVERNWLRPATVSSDLKCEVFVTQSVLGDVIRVRLGACASDIVFRNSIERAVRKSSPLPPPPNPEVFDREIRFVFKPSD